MCFADYQHRRLKQLKLFKNYWSKRLLEKLLCILSVKPSNLPPCTQSFFAGKKTLMTSGIIRLRAFLSTVAKVQLGTSVASTALYINLAKMTMSMLPAADVLF